MSEPGLQLADALLQGRILRAQSGVLYPEHRHLLQQHVVVVGGSVPFPKSLKRAKQDFTVLGLDPATLKPDELAHFRPADGECQASCRMAYVMTFIYTAPRLCVFDWVWTQEAWTTASRSGLSVTAATGVQFRVCPLQRLGWRSRACW